MESMTARYASRVICVSGDLKQRLASKVSREKITVIRNAIDLRECSLASRSQKQSGDWR